MVVVVVAWVCLYFKVSYRYYLIYDCLKLGISHLAAYSELRASPSESLQYMLWMWTFISILWIYNFCFKKQQLWKAITQHDKSSVLKSTSFSSFLPFSLPSPYLCIFALSQIEKLDHSRSLTGSLVQSWLHCDQKGRWLRWSISYCRPSDGLLRGWKERDKCCSRRRKWPLCHLLAVWLWDTQVASHSFVLLSFDGIDTFYLAEWLWIEKKMMNGKELYTELRVVQIQRYYYHDYYKQTSVYKFLQCVLLNLVFKNVTALGLRCLFLGPLFLPKRLLFI